MFVKKIINIVQYVVLVISYIFFSFRRVNKYRWVIGVDEISSIILQLNTVIDGSVSVCLGDNKYYNNSYDYSLRKIPTRMKKIVRLLYGPLLLGFLMNRSDNFFYIWSTGFLYDRDKEFKFLKRCNKIIVCNFVGNDIRSPKLYQDKCREKGLDTFFQFIDYKQTKRVEEKKKAIALTADKYGDLIFSAPFDQASYLTSNQKRFFISLPDEQFNYDPKKFNSNQIVNILHAPSNPMIKGTPLVRAAIKKLELEGFNFNYIELRDKKNHEVLEILKKSHIVLNQFYCLVPGVFGIEAMANHCAMLASADPKIESALVEESNGAWMVTHYWEVYDNLKRLLENPELIEMYANSGFNYVSKYHSLSNVKKYLNNELDLVINNNLSK